MSTFKSKRDEQKVMTGAEVQAIKLPWENNETSSRSSAFNDHGTATTGRTRTLNTIEKEV